VQLRQGKFRTIGLATASVVASFAVLIAVCSVLPPVKQVGAEQRHERERVQIEKLALRPPEAWGQRYTAVERQAETFNLPASKSFLERLGMLSDGWSHIVASPLIGDYGGQIRDHGGFGYYIHNALSAWRQYGLLGFLLYMLLSLQASFLTARETIWRGSQDPMWLLAMLVTVYAVALTFAAKSMFWPLPALAWGLVVARRIPASSNSSDDL
jgi:hypothetical protein